MNRVLYKILSTSLNLFLSTVIFLILAREIGPVSFGNLSYVTATYTFLLDFFMLMSGTAYIYYLSNQKYRREDLNSFILIFVSGVSLILLFIGLVAINSNAGIEYLWNGLDDYDLFYLCLVFVILVNLQKILLNFSDSTLQTLKSENIRLSTRFFTFLVIIVLATQKSISANSYLAVMIVGCMLFFGCFIKYLRFKCSNITQKKFIQILKDFYIYLKPLLIFSIISVIYAYIGKYVLQSSSGSGEQGFYNVALQLAMMPVAIISPVMPILMREVTSAFTKDNIKVVKRVFLNNFSKIFSLHAFIAFFLAINAKDIIILTVGRDFLGAAEPLKVLSIYSLLHTFGMFNTILFLSSGRNRQYGQINSILGFLGLLCLIFIYSVGSLNALDLAYLITLFYFVGVICLLYLNLKFLSVNQGKFLLQIGFLTATLVVVLLIVDYLELNLLFEVSLSTLLLLILNFIFNDYLDLKFLWKVGKDKIMDMF